METRRHGDVCLLSHDDDASPFLWAAWTGDVPYNFAARTQALSVTTDNLRLNNDPCIRTFE